MTAAELAELVGHPHLVIRCAMEWLLLDGVRLLDPHDGVERT